MEFIQAVEPLLLAQSPTPTVDGAYFVALASRVLHLLGGMILVGGSFYLWILSAPAAGADEDDVAERCFAGRRGKWAMWVGIATLAVLASGFYNYLFQFRHDYEKFPPAYHMILGVKIVLALVVFFLAAIVAGRSPAALKFRQKMHTWVGVCLVAGIIVVLLGSTLRTFPHVPKDHDSRPASQPATE